MFVDRVWLKKQVEQMKCDEQFWEREMLAMGERWHEIAARTAEKAAYRLCINDEFANGFWDHLESKYHMQGGHASAMALANHIYGLKIIQDPSIEGWQILHVKDIPEDILKHWESSWKGPGFPPSRE